MKRRNYLIVGIAVFLLVIIFVVSYSPNKVEVVSTETPKDTIVETVSNIEFGFNLDSFIVYKSKIKPNEFLSNILLKHHINYQKIDELVKAAKGIYDVRKLAVGKNYTILCSNDSLQKAQYFIYEPNNIQYVVYDLRDSVKVSKHAREVKVKTRSIGGVIHSSLYQTLQDKGVTPVLAIEMANVYAWTIDFYRIQKNDWFKVIYEEKYVEDKKVGLGKIKAAVFNHAGKSFYAFYFVQDSIGDYFDENANSLRRAFLKSPLEYGRLTSGYTMKRFHPVQKRWKAHLGTDYAAPKGTPILATGDGMVIESAYKVNNGNYVKIKHNSTYTTQYLHMSKRAVKVGQFVSQGDVIGYVGSTGLATGPHVCYRFWKNGKQVNHLSEEFPPSEPIADKHKKKFETYASEMKEKLEKINIK
jgi:murein DD-endopeptidase MepM/ murein hydrolase activator NlpD